MKYLLAIACLLPLSMQAHTTDSNGLPLSKEALRQHIAHSFIARRMALAKAAVPQKPVQVASTARAFEVAALPAISSFTAPAGNGSLRHPDLPMKAVDSRA